MFSKSASFYVNKCGAYLRRTMESYRLASTHLHGQAAGASTDATTGLDLGTRDPAAKLRQALVRSHFLLLKVNFELMLHLVGVAAWRVALWEERVGTRSLPDTAMRRRDKKRASLRSHDPADALDELARAAVENHGLRLIVDRVRDVGFDLEGVFRSRPQTWAQIAVAFAVRNLLEHNDGRMDSQFGDHSPYWNSCTWGARGAIPDEGSRIAVFEEDLRETANQMLAAVEMLLPHAQELDARLENAKAFVIE